MCVIFGLSGISGEASPSGSSSSRVVPALRRDRAAVAAGVLAAGGCCASLVYVLARAAVKGQVFAGPYSALSGVDQLRYLAWIRQAGLHVLIADPYRPGASHLYLSPFFVASGLLWRLGLSVQAAYLVWTPVALLVLIWGFAAYAARFLAGRERAAAIALSILYFSPLVLLMDWGGIVNANGANNLVIVAGQVSAYWQAWGYLPTVLALGLMAVFLLGIERLLNGRPSRGALVGTALAGLLVAWLDPWGGIELVLIVAALLALRRGPPGSKAAGCAAIATALPLVYYALIARADAAWSLSQLRISFAGGSTWLSLLAATTPLLLPALLAVRRPRDTAEQLLLLWLLAALAILVVLPADSRLTALEGVSLPFSILVVRGWRRLPLPRAAGVLALVLAIVPGMAYSAATMRDYLDERYVPYALTRGEQRAVDAVAREQGRILATPYLAAALPALAGRASVVPAGERSAQLNALFDGQLAPPLAELLIRDASITTLISDCQPGRASLVQLLGAMGFEADRYGCTVVYRRVGGDAVAPRLPGAMIKARCIRALAGRYGSGM